MTIPTGTWQRDWIRRHGGALDRSVLVRYVQTPSVFGDLRIPAGGCAAHAASFADLTDAELAVLAQQNGFAGTTTVEGSHATWHHEIDFQPADGGGDIGRIEPAGDDQMFEHALDASYVESWSAIDRSACLGGSAGTFFAARRVRGGRVDQLLAVAGDHFIYARARAIELPSAASLGELIARPGTTRDMIIGYLDCEISYGRTARWQIEHSTLPWQRGQPLASAVRAAATGVGDTWRIAVNTLSAAELTAVFTRGTT